MPRLELERIEIAAQILRARMEKELSQRSALRLGGGGGGGVRKRGAVAWASGIDPRMPPVVACALRQFGFPGHRCVASVAVVVVVVSRPPGKVRFRATVPRLLAKLFNVEDSTAVPFARSVARPVSSRRWNYLSLLTRGVSISARLASNVFVVLSGNNALTRQWSLARWRWRRRYAAMMFYATGWPAQPFLFSF